LCILGDFPIIIFSTQVLFYLLCPLLPLFLSGLILADGDIIEHMRNFADEAKNG
jgi:hypothetical protein